MKRCIAAAILLLLLFPDQSVAEKPADSLDRYLTRVLEIVKSYDQGQGEGEEKALFLKRLSRAASEIFDFRIMARMSLARQWRILSDSQQEDFVFLFTKLLEGNYFGKMLKYMDEIKRFSRENISIIDEVVYSPRRAEVSTVISFKEVRVPITYRFVCRDGPWRIYDISLENISLIQNYRAQFKGVLQKKSCEAFLDMLRKKAKENTVLNTSAHSGSGD